MNKVKASTIILSHLGDLQIDGCQWRINFVKFLVMKFPNTDTEINPDEEYKEFCEKFPKLCAKEYIIS